MQGVTYELARVTYPLRTILLMAQAVNMLASIWQYGTPWYGWFLFVYGLMWPHVAYWRARGRDHKVELMNFTLDGLYAGVMLPILSFHILPCTTVLTAVMMSSLAVGGTRSLKLSLLAMSAGVLVSGAAHGFHLQLETTPLTVLASLPAASLYPALVGLVTYRQTRQLAVVRRKLRIEQVANEVLLLNVLPSTIAARLKYEPSPIADHFDAVTVLFADIVGFTALAQSKPAVEVVQMLNTVFSSFDTHVERLGLEKVKTIGDAYMVAAGVPTARGDHAEAVAEMALAMLTEIERVAIESNQPLSVRIGMHTGSVVAGIIGKKKFSYDLWGDTVNTASRMESHGIPGRIQVSAAVREVLGAKYLFGDRGEIEINCKGRLRVFILLQRV